MYRHASVLILRLRGEEALLILSFEGVTQGDPLDMVLYALCMTSLVEHVREEVPELLKPWYANDCCLKGRARSIARALAILEEYGPLPGFFPEPSKSTGIGGPDPTTPAGLSLAGVECTRLGESRYIGGFTRTNSARKESTPR